MRLRLTAAGAKHIAQRGELSFDSSPLFSLLAAERYIQNTPAWALRRRAKSARLVLLSSCRGLENQAPTVVSRSLLLFMKTQIHDQVH